MIRRAPILALLLASALSVAATDSPAPVPQTAKAVVSNPVPKQTPASARKPAQLNTGEASKNSRGTRKTPLSSLEERNLGLGCAQG